MSGVPTAMGYWAWHDVDPLRHTFEPSRVAPIARANIAQGEDRSVIEEAIDRALLAEYGMWIDAFAKSGRERYAIASDTRSRFEAALDEANDLDTPAATRAAKAYLDVCFFHPFEDGNARAARLVLDHVLMRAGLALHAVDPVFVVSRAADDPRGAWGLAYVIDHLAGRSGLA